MTEELFYAIFDNEILPLIIELEENNRLIKRKNLEECKRQIYHEYSTLKRSYKDKIFGEKSDENVLDRHKVAACICAAFLKISVFYKDDVINQIKKTNQKIEAIFYYVNEAIAFQAGCRFLCFFMVSEQSNDHDRAVRTIQEFPVLPPVKQSTVDCYANIMFNLSQVKTDQIGLDHFDLYSYSMFFFMLESYYNSQAA